VATAIFSMEMSREALAIRMISSLGRVDQNNLRNGDFKQDGWDRINSAVQMMEDAPIYIDDSPALSPTEVRARARRLKRESNIGLIVLDYLQLMQVPGNNENRTAEVSEISRSLKALARELEIPIIALSQLNRGIDSRTDKTPLLSDLRDSGSIEQDADTIAFIYREEFYNADTPRKGIADINISKQRNGPTGKFVLTFIGKYTKFENHISDGFVKENFQ
jgi:replicative DNA helicase